MDFLSVAVLDQIEYKTEKGYSQEFKKTSEACIDDLFYTFGSISHCIKDSTMIDPAAGSGSILLEAKKQFDAHIIEKGFYGQETNHTNYNLARMNMFLHNIN